MSAKDESYYYKTGYGFFLNDPEDGIYFFKEKAKRDEAAKIAIKEYCDPVDGWSEDVSNVIVGIVTGSAQQIDIIKPIGKIDEDGCDENSEYWGDGVEYKCNYAIKPVTPDTLEHYFGLLAKSEQDEGSLSLDFKQSQVVERLFWELWDDALNENAMLLMDVGYNRVTNWVVAVWDSSGVGITDAPRVAYTDGLYSRAEAMLAAAKQLVDYIDGKKVAA